MVRTVLVALAMSSGIGCGSGEDRDTPNRDPRHGAIERDVGAGRNEPVQTGPKVWTCAMHPQIKLPKSGQCPICAMDLIPLVTGGGDREEDFPRLSMSAAAAELADIQTIPVRRMLVSKRVRMVGKVDYDESRVKTIAARVSGRIDRLYADYTGMNVKKGDHLVSLYSPELRTAQEELLQATRARGKLGAREKSVLRGSASATRTAAREKLRLLGLTTEQIQEIERRGAPTDHLTIYAPIGGTVVDKHAVEGTYVEPGTPIYTIADLSRVWIRLDAYESDMSWIRYGQDVTFAVEAYPGKQFDGLIVFVDPVIDPKTRTVKVRVNVENPDGTLKPGMFVRAVVKADVSASGKVMDPSLSGKWISPMHPEVIRDEPGPCSVCGMPLVKAEDLGYVSATQDSIPLVVPASAPLVTGERAVVYVRIPEESKITFEGREVVLGPKAGDYYVVRSGLSEGEEVVVKGNFKIDSALQILARPSMMSAAEGDASEAAHHHDEKDADAQESVEQVSVEKTLEVPTSFRERLRPLYREYLAILEALAADDPGRARVSYGQFAAALGGVDATSLEGQWQVVWMDLSQRLSKSVALGQEADDLAKAREAFDPLSREMIVLASRFGIPAHQELAQVYCPMAFGGKGATWLQAGEDVLNPYFGAQMISCGEIQKRFGAHPAGTLQ
jgi:Cu(I)/Ag(I) efflux system membrane fusion protein